MLIVQGDKILAQMKNVDVQLDNVIIDVGQNYVIKNFEVEKNSGHYKAAHHGFTINFVKATKVTPHKILEIPKTMYNFTMFDDIVSGSINKLFDRYIFKICAYEQLEMLGWLVSLMMGFV